MPRDIQEEVDRNYDAFLKLLPSIRMAHAEKFALMKDEKIISYFSSAEDARVAAELLFKGDVYSIQQVTSSAIDLGFYNYAVPVS